MKIQVSPPQIAVRVVPHMPGQPLPGAGGMELLRQNLERLDLTRQRTFTTKGSGLQSQSEVDEAAVVLVELSVLVYGKLDSIGKTAARLRDSCLGLFGKEGSRDADLQWLEREPKLAEFVRNLSQSFRREHADPASFTLRQPSPEDVSSPEEVLFRAVSGFKKQKKPQDSPPADFQEAPPVEALLAKRPTNAAAEYRAEKSRRNNAPHGLAIMHDDTAMICFRGTLGGADWLLDFCAWPALRWPVRHWGFEKRWQSLRPQIEKWLEAQAAKIGRRPILYIGGHSLGGAIATLAAADLSRRYDVARVVTIGSPRPGGLFFRQCYRRSPAAVDASGKPRTLERVTTRFVHGMDAITFVPPWPIFQHLGAANWLAAKDRVLVDDYFSFQPVKPFSNLLGQAGVGSQGDVTLPSLNWRYMAAQCARYVSTIVPDAWGMRVLAPFAPILLEGLTRSFFHHKSARYLEFFPATEMRMAMAETEGEEKKAQGQS